MKLLVVETAAAFFSLNCARRKQPLRGMRFIATAALCFVLTMLSPSIAQDNFSFKDKLITMIVGFPAGGGADVIGRLVAQYLTKYLSGHPTIVVKDQPGANGTTALNYMVQQTAPDGLTIALGSNGQVDPFNYRKPQVIYDPSKFIYIGGIGRGGEFLIISKKALPRLYDKTQPPVIMGSVGSMPRSGMQVTAWCIEYLGCNARWVVGYAGTNDLMIALQRGEIDMTATANSYEVERMVREGNFAIALQSGTLLNGKVEPRPEFIDAPLFPIEMQGKISDPTAQQAFDYWLAINTIDKWVGVIEGTSPAIVNAYRGAFAKLAEDREFLEGGKQISDDFTPMPHEEVESLIHTLAATTPEAMHFMTGLLRKQGLQVTD